jgi:monoamine oxidase
MPRTPLAQHIQHLYSTHHEAHQRGVPVEQVREERAERRVSRRDFLRAAGVAAGAAALAGRVPLANAATAPRITIVGAGLAGLSAAYTLRQAGYLADVYEAADRVGGRCWTLRGAFNDGQIVEHGGELIDQGHTAIRQLAQSLGLTLDNLLQAEKNGAEPLYYFDAGPYTYAQASADFNAVYQKLHRDVSEASYPTLFDNYTPRGWELDHLSIIDWINKSVPGGTGSKFGQLLDVAYNIEYGGESSQQSSLNLLYLLGYSGQGQLRIFGPSNEKYHVRGGNDQIVTGLAQALAPGQIRLGHELVAIRLNANGSYGLTFKKGRTSVSVTADHVVLALPFSILRASVDYRDAGFSTLKKTAIKQQGIGTNAKLHLQFTRRHWESLNCNGETFADTGYQNTWDVSRAQPGASGLLVNYTGGNVGAGLTGSATTRAAAFLQQIEPVLPGLSATWNGKASLDHWTSYPWTKGSYSYWKVGQYTQFAGIEGRPEGPNGTCHFCGEHTSIDFQGYLNGAVETGQRAAGEILGAL